MIEIRLWLGSKCMKGGDTHLGYNFIYDLLPGSKGFKRMRMLMMNFSGPFW